MSEMSLSDTCASDMSMDDICESFTSVCGTSVCVIFMGVLLV